jgi:nitrous oxidase accessory protein NosD
MRNNGDGAHIWATAGLSRLRECDLIDNVDYGITITSPQEVQISDTYVVGGRVGIQFDNCPGFIENCTIENVMYSGIVLLESGTVVTVADNTLQNNGWHVDISNYATVDLHQNELLNSQLYGIWIGSPSTVHVNENDLISSQGYLAYLTGDTAPEIRHYDFTNNYWGTTDPTQIAARIYDNHDSALETGIAEFEPFAGAPVPTEATSFGGLKALFRSGR